MRKFYLTHYFTKTITCFEFAIYQGLNLWAYGKIFNNIIVELLFLIFTIVTFGNQEKITVKMKAFLISNLLFISMFSIAFVLNLPKYTYYEAVKSIGEIKHTEGVKSFQYRKDGTSFNSDAYSNFLTGRDYNITAIVDGRVYGFHFNPYSGEYKEFKDIISNVDLKKKYKYKKLY